jgi:hypothetical protein
MQSVWSGNVRKQLLLSCGLMALLAGLQPSPVSGEGLNIIPPEARRSSMPRPPSDRAAAMRARRAARPAKPAARPSTDHLADFIDHILGRNGPAGLKASARRIARPAHPAVAPPAMIASPAAPQGVPSPGPGPVVTESIPSAEPTSATTTIPFPAAPPVTFAAEKAQAGFDLIKLELARRTYNETKLAGEPVFVTHPDWRVLERAQQAMEPAELAVANAAGFVATAYINDATRTIVVAIAGSQDLRRHLITSDIWQALIKAEAPQQFYMAKSYVRAVAQRYQAKDYTVECVGHSLGGGACAYVATELGLRAIVVNPIAAGKLQPAARSFVTNYVVDGDVAQRVYAARGNEFAGDLLIISDGQDQRRQRIIESYGPLSGPILLIRALPDSLRAHRIDTALDQISHFAETTRAK